MGDQSARIRRSRACRSGFAATLRRFNQTGSRQSRSYSFEVQIRCQKSVHSLKLIRTNQRPDITVHQSRPDLQRANPLTHQRQHFFIRTRLNQQARSGAARLAGVLNDGVNDDGDRFVQIRVSEHNLRALAA